MKLSKIQARVLLALADGCALKSHRYLDGRKVYQLHPLDRPGETVRQATVACLVRHRLIDSNKKFPAATYWLTAQGRELATTLHSASAQIPDAPAG